MPDEDGTFRANRDNGLLIGSDGYVGNDSRVTLSDVVAEAFIVVPKLDQLVLSSSHKVLSLSRDGQSVQLARVRAVEHPDGLSVEAVPVGDFSV